MSTTAHNTLLVVGHCGPAHGVRGEVKVIPETDDPQRLLELERVWVGTSEGDAVERVVERARIQPGKRGPVVLMLLQGVPDRDGAEALRRQRVFALAEELPALEEGEMYLHDLIGLEVFAEADEAEPEHIGTVHDIIEGSAQDLLVVRRNGRPDALIPDVPEIVTGVDLEARRITTQPPEGLLD